MILEFSQGKLIANAQELMVRLDGAGRPTMQAQVDVVELIGIANVITAFGGGISWSVQLDSAEQLQQLAQEMGLEIKGL